MHNAQPITSPKPAPRNLDLSSPTNEHLYATIPKKNNRDQQHTLTVDNNSSDQEAVYSRQDSSVVGTPELTEGPSPKPKSSQSPGTASRTSADSAVSNPPPYESHSSSKKEEEPFYTEFKSLLRPSTKTNTDSLSKLKIKLGYLVQQRAFVISITALVIFIAAYVNLMSKHWESISNLKNPSSYVPIIVASILAVSSVVTFILSSQDTRIKKTGVKSDSEIFSTMRGLKKTKCIKSIELELSNNTNYTLLDSKKYKTLAFKELELTLRRPLINAEIAAFVTLTATYLFTKGFEMGPANLANSLTSFNTSNTELMAFTVAAGIVLALLVCSFIHYYRKTYVESLEIEADPIKAKKLYNREYIKAVESHYNDRGTLSSGKHSKGKAASLTIDQAKVEYYNSEALIIAAIS